MAKQLNKLDELIKSTYESHEYEYDPSVWDEVEKEISISTPPFSAITSSIGIGLATVAIVFGSLAFVEGGSGSRSELVDLPEETGTSLIAASNDETKSEVKDEADADTATATALILSEENTKSEESESSIAVVVEEENQVSEESANMTIEQKETAKALIEIAKDFAHEEESNSTATETNEDGLSIVKGCTGMTIDFEAPTNYGENAKYLWNFGDGYFSNEENPTHTFQKEGVFDVSLSVTAVGSGQISSNVVEAMIEIHKAPIADFEIKVGGINELVLSSTSQNTQRFEWSANGEALNSNAAEVDLLVDRNKKYEFQLNAKNGGNCEDYAEKVIHVIEAGNQFPQSYSTSYATDFAPGAIVDNGEVLEFKVFDAKSGDEIFSSSGRKGWDGKDSTNVKVAPGMYKWMMVVKGRDAHNVFSGDLQLK